MFIRRNTGSSRIWNGSIMPATKMNRTIRSNLKRNRESAYAPSDDRNSVNTSDGSVMMKLFGR